MDITYYIRKHCKRTGLKLFHEYLCNDLDELQSILMLSSDCLSSDFYEVIFNKLIVYEVIVYEVIFLK